MNNNIIQIYRIFDTNRCYTTLKEANTVKNKNDLIIEYNLKSGGDSGVLAELAWEEIIQEMMLYVITMEDSSMYAIKQLKSLDEKTFLDIWSNCLTIKLYFIKSSKII